MGAIFDCRYLVPVTIHLSSKSQFFQGTIKNLLHFLIHQDHLHKTTILIVLIFLLLLFLRTKITLSMNAKPIHFEIQDSPSEALLILLPASFLWPPTLFWKVFIIVVASSPWPDRLSRISPNLKHFAKSQFFQETIKNSLDLLIQQDHLHQTTILVPLVFLVYLFLRIKITLNLNRRPIRVEIQDSPSETLLILLAASFLLPPVLFWKVLVIVAASPLWLDPLSDVVRRSHQAIELPNRAPVPVHQIPAEVVIDVIGTDDQAHGIIQPEAIEGGDSTEFP